MVNRGQLILGLFLVLMGVLFLIGTVFQIDVWAICWPAGLIAVGVWLLLRPRMAAPGMASDTVLLGDLRRRGSWKVQDMETWLGVVDVEMDFSQAEIPPGETRLKFMGFVGDVDLYIPTSIGVAVYASGLVVETEIFGHKQESIFSPVQYISDGYEDCERRLRIEMTGFVTDLKVKPG